MSIVKLAPAIKCYPWGGTALQSKFGWNSEDVIGQGWLLSDIRDNESEVITGPYAGDLFSAYLKLNPQSVGTLGKDAPKFPVSIKIIDNQKPSAVVVNPDAERESIFYIVSAGENATIHYGVNKDLTQDQLKTAIQDGTIGSMLKEIPVKAGDVFMVKAGTPYAIGTDLQVLEIMEESPLKEFSPEEVVDSIRLSPISHDYKIDEWVKDGQAESALLGQTGTFKADLIQLNGSMSLTAADSSFEALVFLDGNATIDGGDHTLHAVPGDSFYISAGSGPYTITGNARFIQVHLI